MWENNIKIQSDLYRKFSSIPKTIAIHLANFRYNHKDDPETDDVYINREQLENKLESWLLSPDKSGSYLVAGYRGMGKSSLVNHVLNRITRPSNPKLERFTRLSAICLSFAIFCVAFSYYWPIPVLTVLAVYGILRTIYNYFKCNYNFNTQVETFPDYSRFAKNKLHKLFTQHDGREKKANRIKIKINLGKEVMNERDVLCLITNQIRIRYNAYLHMGQNKPLSLYGVTLICSMLSVLIVKFLASPLFHELLQLKQEKSCPSDKTHFLENLWFGFLTLIQKIQSDTVLRLCCYILAFGICFWLSKLCLDKILCIFDRSKQSLHQLRNLSDRLSSSVSEADGNIPNISGSLLNISILGRKHKESPIANVRDIETELTSIINTLNSNECFPYNRVQFIIVFDELDKVEYRTDKETDKSPESELTPPDFSTAIEGFSGSMTNSERRRTVLQLLANMKLFLTSARAKFIFISGRELYEAFLADVSDREYAISSIFNGVINVNSFLRPEREQSDISSMTEQYVAEILLPHDYLWKKTEENAEKNHILKREVPSLRWYIEYLTEQAKKELQGEKLRQREAEIRHIVMFLRCFTVYLSHVSNGSPKKIVLYFEKYVKRLSDHTKLYDWDDSLECGVPNKYLLYFTQEDQQKIGFISHLTAPIMDVIINNLSNYDDKLLIAASFLIDHLFKFHGRGFSWRNIEQTPELLDVNKTAELRDFITSIIEFMQQTHLSSIMVGLFQFKFRKRISEEISHISRISDEAAAIFNFTLNETQAVKHHNVKLLDYYITLSNKVGNSEKEQHMYDDIVARTHATLGDLYFQEEDYTRALQEYRSCLNFLDRNRTSPEEESPSAIISRIRCMLKMGLTCEYCKNYETAYAIYCNLVDTMISVREVAEQKIGLDIIDTYTYDWRIKQPMVVDPGVRMSDDLDRKWRLGLSDSHYRLYRAQNIPGLWDDGVYDERNSTTIKTSENRQFSAAEYSLEFDRLTSGFAKNLSPEKSHFVARLSMFEDVRLIYKAILAKLFILEKMNMSGITQSNIEIAEAEFKYLHRTVNIKEKFFISADFFNQLGKILFYKNNLALLPGMSEKKRNETLFAALYWWNINLYAYLDDFCFMIHQSPTTEGFINQDAVSIKRYIQDYFDKLTIKEIERMGVNIGSRRALILNDIFKKIKINIKGKTYGTILTQYINYISNRINKQTEAPFCKVYGDKIKECSNHRSEIREKSWNLPCYACKYYNQSLRILMQEMFVIDKGSDAHQDLKSTGSKSLQLLRLSFRKYLRYSRVNHLRLLAMNIVSMGNTMYSCASDRSISKDSILLIQKFLEDGSDDIKEKLIHSSNAQLCKLDKAMLYYLAAYRYYNIAKQPKDASDCLFKIITLLNEVVTVINFDKKTSYEKTKEQTRKNLDCQLFMDWGPLFLIEDNNQKSILDVLFTRFAKAVSEQYGYSVIPELYDYKWLYHANANEDINLTRLQIYSDLKEIIWLISDTRTKILNIMAYFGNTQEKKDHYTKLRRDEIRRAYQHFQPLGQINDTFFNKVISYYARFRLNKCILKDIFGRDPMVNPNDSHEYNKHFTTQFVTCLEEYLSSNDSSDNLGTQIFGKRETAFEKQQLIEFLIDDSIVCLTEIIYILPPYNHISSFTNSFVAEVYAQMWEQAKMYETLILLYDYRQYHDETVDIHGIFQLWKHKINKKNIDDLEEAVSRCCQFIDENNNLKARYGSLSSRFAMNIRHKIDDRTLHHVISNYAAEMALRYYALTESSHSEGNAYRNQISRNYVLNDDLENDTWLFNTTVERYRLHTEYIQSHRRRLTTIYRDSRFYKYDGYMLDKDAEKEFAEIYDDIRFDDSLHINSEL